jgi:dephospho-CoA kinase
MIVVGLTGNYGSGKSTVARMFSDLGATNIDTDVIVRNLLEEGDVIEEIRTAFGEEALSGGAVNKKWLSEWVFRDAHARVTLEDILHPRVFRKLEEELAGMSCERDHIVIVEATVVFERGHQGKFDKIVTVYAPEEITFERLKEKGVTEADARQRLSSQLPAEIKMRGSDFIIDNSRGIESTREQARTIYQELLSSEKRNGNN